MTLNANVLHVIKNIWLYKHLLTMFLLHNLLEKLTEITKMIF